MADVEQILEGSYDGIPFSIRSSVLEGGRKSSVKQFPNRDTQSVEDLGLRPRQYSLDIIVSDKSNQEYFGYRNSLLQSFETKGGKVLIHPLYGRIDDVIATEFSFTESDSSFGDSIINVVFQVNNNTGIPQQSDNVVTQISSANDLVQSSIQDDIADNFNVTSSFTGNFSSAVDKVNDIIDATVDSTSFIGETAQDINAFNSQIGELSANVNSLVTQPIELADSIVGLFESTNGLYASSAATFETFIGFFGFGDDDEPIPQNTAIRVERDKNNAVLNGAVGASSLSYAYLASTGIDFQTTREIDNTIVELNEQYDTVMTGGSSQDVKDNLTDMRIKVFAALEQIRVNTSQVITVETVITSARLLAFSYYGNDENGEDIINLNGFTDISFIEGDVEILTA